MARNECLAGIPAFRCIDPFSRVSGPLVAGVRPLFLRFFSRFSGQILASGPLNSRFLVHPVSGNSWGLLFESPWAPMALTLGNRGWRWPLGCIALGVCIYKRMCICTQRNFKSQTSDNMDRWKSRGGKSQRREEKKKESEDRRCRCAER